MEFRFKFESIDELNAWLDHCCTRCAMRNLDCGKGDPCCKCKANKVYETKAKELRKEDKK